MKSANEGAKKVSARVRFLAVAAMGFGFILSQVLILREFLLVFHGNEFSIGLVLGNWFLLEALGSWVCGKLAPRSRSPVVSFVALQIALALLLPLTLVMILASRCAPVMSPWEALSLTRIWVVSFLILIPLAFGNGAAFVYGCNLFSWRREPAGEVYFLESLGAFVGGLAFTFLLVGRLHALGIAFLLGALNMFCLCLLLFGPAVDKDALGAKGSGRSKVAGVLRVVCPFLLAFFVAGVVSPLSLRIEQQASRARWAPLGVRDRVESVYGNITVVELEEELIFYLNGVPSLTLPDPDTAALEELVHLPLLAHGRPRKVLFMGGGVGGALGEVLEHPVENVFYTELDPLLIETVERLAPVKATAELGDPRTRVLYEDGRFFVRRTDEGFDVILTHLPDAATLQLNRFFTMEFFSLVRERLLPGGVFAFSVPGSSVYLSEELARLNRCVRDTLAQVFTHVRVVPGERNLFLASPDLNLESLSPGILAARLEQRAVNTSVIRPSFLNYKLDPFQAQWLEEELEALSAVRINQDLSPSLLYYTLAFRNIEVQPGLRGAFLFLEGLGPRHLMLGLVVLSLPLFTWALLKRGKRRLLALSISIFSTGFAGMVLEMVMILWFQSVYGYVYEWMGLLIAAFMAGLGAGAWLMTRWLPKLERGYWLFCFLEGLQLGFLLLVVGMIMILFTQGDFPGSAAGAEAPRILLLGLNLLAGLLVGAEFPLANHEAAAGAQQGRSARAGRFYALDLAGAWLGAFLVSVILVPLVGIPQTLLLTAALKAMGLVFLRLGEGE